METGKSQIGVLVRVLRELLRAQGLRPRNVAERLGVSERTVLRWFAGEAIDTRVLERLCALIEISFFELCEVAAKRVETRLARLSADQEQALVDDALLNYLFVNILRGWSAAELQHEIDVPEAMFIDALIRLEKIGLIGLLPGNEFRLKTTREIQWRKGGPYSRYVNMFLKWSLNNADTGEPKSAWVIEALKLSTGSLAQLQHKFQTLREEANALSQVDRRSNDMSREWYALVLATRRIDFTPLQEWPTQYHMQDIDGDRPSVAVR
jgi:transcriptional regulator with XRE-family HTH domain